MQNTQRQVARPKPGPSPGPRGPGPAKARPLGILHLSGDLGYVFENDLCTFLVISFGMTFKYFWALPIGLLPDVSPSRQVCDMLLLQWAQGDEPNALRLVSGCPKPGAAHGPARDRVGRGLGRAGPDLVFHFYLVHLGNTPGIFGYTIGACLVYCLVYSWYPT